MICVPPEHYVVVQNPVVRDAQGVVVVDDKNEDKLKYGDEEIRFHQEPFPLYFGEEAGTFQRGIEED
jgi:major vault protein